jgi:diaminohydroxyphosphoribosylaminopyrimidine deaminase/5-amino-6-(5-phosphoribosylamino)uracil reductase
MRQAIELAKRGEGFVEPNPMVGCVLVRDGVLIGSGWHQRFGGPHAEINALGSIERVGLENESTQLDASGATAFVTLEPCAHTGKTGPCSEALIEAGISRVVIGSLDPNPLVAGNGIRQLTAAGIEVSTGVLQSECEQVLAPYLKLKQTGKPWLIAKWAMTLDGKIATASGDSQWISNQQSRRIVHQVRGRVDGILVGIGTAIADDPMLNARPAGTRIASRIVVDSTARIPLESKLVRTANQFPTLISVGPGADKARIGELENLGCEVFQATSSDANDRLCELLDYLGSNGLTNVLVEGGGQLLGSLHDLGQLDECHIFVGPKLLGGTEAPSPVGGMGVKLLQDSNPIEISQVEQLGMDIHIVGRVKPSASIG